MMRKWANSLSEINGNSLSETLPYRDYSDICLKTTKNNTLNQNKFLKNLKSECLNYNIELYGIH